MCSSWQPTHQKPSAYLRDERLIGQGPVKFPTFVLLDLEIMRVVGGRDAEVEQSHLEKRDHG